MTNRITNSNLRDTLPASPMDTHYLIKRQVFESNNYSYRKKDVQYEATVKEDYLKNHTSFFYKKI